MKGEDIRSKGLESILSKGPARKDTFHHTAIVNDKQHTTTVVNSAKVGGTSTVTEILHETDGKMRQKPDIAKSEYSSQL